MQNHNSPAEHDSTERQQIDLLKIKILQSHIVVKK